MRFLKRRMRREEGSLPMALLASIVVAGLAVVLTARMIEGEEQVRFDRAFTESFHAADAGVQEAMFHLNAGLYQDKAVGWESTPATTSFGDDTYTWTLHRDNPRSWTVTSEGTQNGVSRTVQATVEEEPLFFPGAFGDTLIAFNGTSTSVDSYNSGSCTTPAADCRWGEDDDFGTGNGSIATNGVFDFSGNPSLRPGSAFLYDWEDNPAEDVDLPEDPFGNRCDGNPCTTTYVSTIDKALEYSSDAQMQFIHSALDDCDGTNQDQGEWVFGGNGNGPNSTAPDLVPYEADSTWAVTDPVDPDFENYYCAESLQFRNDTALADTVTSDEPVVIFVRDFVKVENQAVVGCETTDGSECSKNKTSVEELRASDTRPQAARLQIYVAAEEGGGGKKGANITYEANSIYAGVMYGPRSRCGGPGGATVDIFGAIICGSMDNVGNWQFHYDDQLGTYGTSLFGIGYYTEEPGLDP